MIRPAKARVCLWYVRGAEDAARFYADVFPDTHVTAIQAAFAGSPAEPRPAQP